MTMTTNAEATTGVVESILQEARLDKPNRLDLLGASVGVSAFDKAWFRKNHALLISSATSTI